MSGHSKWATIKRKKGLIDAERGKVFQKLAKELFVAAKGTDGNPDTNPALRMVVDKAKAANMPKDKIASAIDKACKSTGGEDYEFVRYEGYGPNGVAIMVDCLTDNRNRTASMVRSTFTKRGGNLGTDGSVSYMFERKGVILVPNTYNEDDVMTIALENDALDFNVNEDSYEITTTPEDFVKMNKALEEANITDFMMNEVRFIPSNYINLSEDQAAKIMGLIDALEELDDVSDVFHNLEID
jgi:YebC/PmpR family DNA-binding regulatory protein